MRRLPFVIAVIAVTSVIAGAAAAHHHGARLFDLRTTRGRAALPGFSVRDLSVGAVAGQIRAITRPRFDSPGQAARLLDPTDLVVGVDIRGDARAYPVDLLALHELVDDVVGGEPVAISWCPLCASALVFDRHLDGRVLTFDVSGLLYHANQVLYDRQTRSLWSQLGGAAVTGRLRGTRLRLEPAVEQPWRVWRAAHPRTRVLSIRHDVFAARFLHPYTYVDARGEEASDDPYLAYDQKVSVFYGRPIDGISGASRVVGLERGGLTKAYPEALIARRRVVDDTFAGTPLVVFWTGGESTPAVFSRRVGARALRFRRQGAAIRDTATGSRWDPSTGRALGGPLAGSALRPLAFTFPYWFAWRSFHPRTLVFRGANGGS